jgi:hypothetical protein
MPAEAGAVVVALEATVEVEAEAVEARDLDDKVAALLLFGLDPDKNIVMTAELKVVEAIPTVVVVGVVLPVEVKAVEVVGPAIMLEVATKLEAVREAVVVLLVRVESVEAPDLETAIDAVILGKVAALDVGVVEAPNEDQDLRAVDLGIVIVAAACTGKYQIEVVRV